eukprot:5826836-Karenia_brevis.AAC.1
MKQEAAAVKEEQPGSSSSSSGLQLRGHPPAPQPRESRLDWESANSHDHPGGEPREREHLPAECA